jgi:hypothetical protein
LRTEFLFTTAAALATEKQVAVNKAAAKIVFFMMLKFDV